MQLSKNERFIKEYTNFKERADKVTNESVKKEIYQLLSKLQSEVQAIDQKHHDVFFGSTPRLGLDDSHSNILLIRRKISQKLIEFEKLNG